MALARRRQVEGGQQGRESNVETYLSEGCTERFARTAGNRTSTSHPTFAAEDPSYG
jgi:uncharacterized protein YlaI